MYGEQGEGSGEGKGEGKVGKICLLLYNNTKWCNGFYIQFRQNFTKETFSYDEHLKS